MQQKSETETPSEDRGDELKALEQALELRDFLLLPKLAHSYRAQRKRTGKDTDGTYKIVLAFSPKELLALVDAEIQRVEAYRAELAKDVRKADGFVELKKHIQRAHHEGRAIEPLPGHEPEEIQKARVANARDRWIERCTEQVWPPDLNELTLTVEKSLSTRDERFLKGAPAIEAQYSDLFDHRVSRAVGDRRFERDCAAEDCGRSFFASHGNKRYCSTTCSGRGRKQRHLAKKAAKLETQITQLRREHEMKCLICRAGENCSQWVNIEERARSTEAPRSVRLSLVGTCGQD